MNDNKEYKAVELSDDQLEQIIGGARMLDGEGIPDCHSESTCTIGSALYTNCLKRTNGKCPKY